MTDGWLGLAISPKGDRVYVGGGSAAAVFEFSLANGVLTAARTFPILGTAEAHARRISSATWRSRPTAA